MGLLFLEHNRYYQAFPRLCFLIFFGLSQAKSGSYIRITNITSPTVSECVYISRVQGKSFLKLAIWASPWADLGGGCRGCAPPPPPPPEMTCGFLIQLVFCKKKTVVYWCWQETSAPPPKKILDPPLKPKRKRHFN